MTLTHSLHQSSPYESYFQSRKVYNNVTIQPAKWTLVPFHSIQSSNSIALHLSVKQSTTLNVAFPCPKLVAEHSDLRRVLLPCRQSNNIFGSLFEGLVSLRVNIFDSKIKNLPGLANDGYLCDPYPITGGISIELLKGMALG